MSPDLYEPLPGIRRFRELEIDAAIEKALATVPDGVNGAAVAYATTEGARLAVAGRLGHQWSIVVAAASDWSGELEGEAAVRFTW
jgi:hypothetical protein